MSEEEVKTKNGIVEDEKIIPNSEDQIPDNASVKLDSNSEAQLVHRRNVNSDSDVSTTDVSNDRREDISPAILDVGDLQTVTLGHINKIDVLKDENGLGKGVVLNATQLYPARWVSENISKDKINHELKQSYLVAGNHVFETSLEKKEVEQLPETRGNKMSLTRKILFGASFLPSILFVLCFAIILPCEEPRATSLCEKILWSAVFNDTDLYTNLALSNEALLISSSAENDKLLSLNLETGIQLWNSILNFPITQINCDDFDSNADDIYDCLVMTENGFLYAYNSSNGHIFWNYNISGSSQSKFTVLSDCDDDGTSEIAVAVSPSEIQIISNGSPKLPVILLGCKTTPKNLTSWFQHGTSNLIYICETDSGNEKLAYIKQESWCPKEKKLKAEIHELLNSDQMDFGHILLKSTDDGLVAWAKHFLAFFGANGTKVWHKLVSNHYINRFLFYGNFSSIEKEIALISGDSTSNSLITLINASNGNELFSQPFKLANAENAVILNGKMKDSILVLLQESIEIKENSSLTSTLISMNRPTTVIDIEMLNIPKPVQPKHKLVLLQFHTQDSTVKLQEKNIRSEVIPHTEESTSLAAYVDGKNLKIYFGQTEITSSEHVTSTIQAFQVNNWDEAEVSKCK